MRVLKSLQVAHVVSPNRGRSWGCVCTAETKIVEYVDASLPRAEYDEIVTRIYTGSGKYIGIRLK